MDARFGWIFLAMDEVKNSSTNENTTRVFSRLTSVLKNELEIQSIPHEW
jgi:hypothetical protein